MTPTHAVFDLFGTLIRPGLRLHSFRNILLWARENGRKPLQDDARRLMTANLDCKQLLFTLGITPPADKLAQLCRDIQCEVDNLTLYDDVVPTLTALASQGVVLEVCSNLAKPYGIAIDRLLPQFNLTRHLSYTVGAIKPEREIYDSIVNKRGIKPAQILFVGDTLLADYQGPIKFGFQARHLVRTEPPDHHKITSLAEVLPLFASK